MPPPPDVTREERALFWGNLVLAACVAAYLGHVFATSGTAGLAELATVAGLSFVAFGKLVIFWGLKEGAIPVWSLAVMTFLIDLVLASALASGLRGLERAPLIGGWMHNSRARAKEVLLEYPGLRRMAFFGVVAFVLLPIAGTGAITGSIVARLLGLPRLSGIGAIALASGWAALSFSLLAYFLGEQGEALIKNPLIVAGVIGLIGAAGWTLYKRVLAELRRKT
jgi:uncharacterized membrane protein